MCQIPPSSFYSINTIMYTQNFYMYLCQLSHLYKETELEVVVIQDHYCYSRTLVDQKKVLLSHNVN